MRIRLRLFFLLLITSIFVACDGHSGRSISTNVKDGNVKVEIVKFGSAEKLHVQGVVVYGNLSITADIPIKNADLRCIHLVLKNKKSTMPYVDSMIDTMLSVYPAENDGIVRARLYWVFEGLDVSKFDVDGLGVKIIEDNGSCPLPGKT